ncbi:manganese catalase [Paeniglutamicibacter gangotriensis Lz1y]|uniref:Manganese catalase n=1 Tax=Paeniglutamicibacter gangotriensis Lz1y TaxID=1276920 RepID=M7MNQ6_9MICC|nr:manganese catalase [Paeniglutamicibacter gangotriensis Lz1y]
MYSHTQLLINEISVDEPDPAAVLQEGLGGQSGGLRTMMQYLFQSTNFRGDAAAKPYKDLLQGIGTEEISAVELVDTSNIHDDLVAAQGLDAGRCGRKPVAGQLRLHQRKPGPGFAMQHDARIHRQAPEVTHHRGDGQQETRSRTSS